MYTYSAQHDRTCAVPAQLSFSGKLTKGKIASRPIHMGIESPYQDMSIRVRPVSSCIGKADAVRGQSKGCKSLPFSYHRRSEYQYFLKSYCTPYHSVIQCEQLP